MTTSELVRQHFAHDLMWRRHFSPPDDVEVEYEKRELVSPLLLCAAVHVENATVRSEAQVRGRSSKGRVDFSVEIGGCKAVVAEVRTDF